MRIGSGRSIAGRATRVAAAAAGLAIAGCANNAPEVDQKAQHFMIGLSETRLKACVGRPDRRIPVGLEEIWVYRIGRLHGYGPPLPPLNETILAPSGPCNVRFVVDRYGVSQIAYTLPSGASLPLGQVCDFDVDRCLAR
jgi:hypothetical protein